MTDRIALALGLVIAAALVFDAVAADWGFSLFLARRFVDLLDWLSFWR